MLHMLIELSGELRLNLKSFSVLVLILTGIPVLPTLTTRVSGQTVGLVCLAPTSVDVCPAPPVTLTGRVGSHLSVAVIIQGAEPINGFDITLKADASVLKPVDADITGSLLSGGSIIVKCIGGELKAGPRCLPTDTSDTIHLLLVGPLTFAPTTGLLFTAMYNITGSASTTIGYQTECSLSSVAGTSVCVLLSDGSISPPQATVQDATYTQSPTPTFTIESDIASAAVQKRSSTTRMIILTSLNGFAGTVSLTVSIAPLSKHPPTVFLNPSTITLTDGGSATSTLTVSTAPNTTQGKYLLTVTGVGGTVSGSVQIQLTVVP